MYIIKYNVQYTNVILNIYINLKICKTVCVAKLAKASDKQTVGVIVGRMSEPRPDNYNRY